jgi:hypothetical protein
MHQIPEEMTGAGSKTVYSEFQKCKILFGIRKNFLNSGWSLLL